MPTTNGFTFPDAHPRLLWTPARKAMGASWLAAHPYTPYAVNAYDVAMQYVLDGTDPSSAITWATTWEPAPTEVTTTADGSDDMRTTGEMAMMVFDWCYDAFTPAQRAAFVTNWNTWIGNVRQQSWGGIGMSGNNYWWGNFRNELLWGIVSWGEPNQSNTTAEDFITYALVNRWQNDFIPSALAGGSAEGGFPLEGCAYGTSTLQYPLLSVCALSDFGRDLYAETPFFKNALYQLLYWRTPAQVWHQNDQSYGWDLSYVNEEDRHFFGGVLKTRNYYEDFMHYMARHATRYGGTMSGLAKKWLDDLDVRAPLQYNPNGTFNVNYYISNIWAATDTTSSITPVAPTSLPLDIWADGPDYGFTRTTWDDHSAWIALFIGDAAAANSVGHAHKDYGSFNIWRGGRWLLRESAGYGQTLAGTPGLANQTCPIEDHFAHNVLAFTNVKLGAGDHYVPGPTLGHPVITRRETKANHFFVAANMTQQYLWDAGHAEQYETGVVGSVWREYVYLRDIETFLVFDRVQTANQRVGGTLTAAQVVTSAMFHYETNPTIEDASHYTCVNGDQALRHTVLIPASPTYRVITEGSMGGQYRVEVDASGAALRYHLNVLQARDSTAADITATLVDSNPANPALGTFTVTVGAHTVVFAKGASSTGGTVDGAALRPDVQAMAITEAGPLWKQLSISAGTPAGGHVRISGEKAAGSTVAVYRRS